MQKKSKQNIAIIIKKLRIFWQYNKDEPTLTYAGAFNKFPGNSALFKFKQKITG